MSLGELLKQRLRRVEFEGQGRLANGNGGGFLAHFLALEVALQRVQEKAVMGYAVPVEYLLLLLRADAIILIQKV